MQKEIPADLQIHILQKLPLSGCIIRLRRVCRSWRALLSEPSFLRQKLSWPDEDADETSSDNSSSLTMMIENHDTDGIERARSVYSLYSCNALKRLREAADIPFNLHNYDITGCCGGLLCFYERRKRPAGARDAILWNPATKETKVLPPTLFNVPCKETWVPAVGLGFDRETNDYKVVRHIHYYVVEDDPQGFRLYYFVEVYSLRNDSWKEIDTGGYLESDDDPFDPIFSYSVEPQCYNGKLYWWRDSSSTEFVSFDMTKEVFEKVDVRNPKVRWDVCSLFVLPSQEDSLVAICSVGRDESLEVWALLKLWVPESWTKLLVVPAVTHLQDLCGMSGNFLFCYYRDIGIVDPTRRIFVAYHLVTGEAIELDMSLPYQIMNYVPSRVSLTKKKNSSDFD
ncbi:unnamed protein product [Linum trigynum]|uniref:F-box domain-containing protein n=1 Tax=Linum trigynum TaxID=586398 RepID=A0AAV2D3T7_9ROSI